MIFNFSVVTAELLIDKELKVYSDFSLFAVIFETRSQVRLLYSFHQVHFLRQQRPKLGLVVFESTDFIVFFIKVVFAYFVRIFIDEELQLILIDASS